MNFPDINPTAFSIFGLSIKWYGIAYTVGFLGGISYAKNLARKFEVLKPKIFDDIIIWTALGTIIGGRLGYVLFYDFSFYINNLLLILLDIRKGGMSFHGGLLGVIIFSFLYAKIKKINFLSIMDIIACCAPIGLFCGRIANFINSELWGKPTSLPWGIVFPNADEFPRHPSQLYEAILEGFALVIIMSFIYSKMKGIKGYTAGSFLIFYGLFRIFSEFFREPDFHMGYITGDIITMGMMLSFPMIIVGCLTILFSLKCQKI